MTITIPTPISPAPSVRRPTVKRFAMAGAAAIAIAAAAVGVTTMLNDDPATTATTTSSSVTNTSAVQTEPAVSAQLDQFAAANGLSGLSPASLGPATTAAVPEAPRVTDTSVEADSAHAFFLGINDAEEVSRASALLDPAAFESAIADAVRGLASSADLAGEEREAVTAADLGSVEWLQANGWLPATATDDVANELVPRTNFASDLDWLVANGFVPSGPR